MKQVFHLKSCRKVKSYLARHFRTLTPHAFWKCRPSLSLIIIPENIFCEMKISSVIDQEAWQNINSANVINLLNN